jgi:cytochrome b subunit of formate dehydrogenase
MGENLSRAARCSLLQTASCEALRFTPREMIQWATRPWELSLPIQIACCLLWVAAIAGLCLLVVHAIWVRYFARLEEFPRRASFELAPSRRPSLIARLCHWIMAGATFTLLLTAFLPELGVEFDWVTYHWIAGMLLTVSILFHVIHASFCLDLRAVCPAKTGLQDAWKRIQRQPAPAPQRSAKYPFENKLYHGAIITAALATILTGVCMMFTPDLFADITWGLMCVLHGLAGVGLMALLMVHVYFAARPEKLELSQSIIFGPIKRESYPERDDSKGVTVEEREVPVVGRWQ